jgi:hypothetical protein
MTLGGVCPDDIVLADVKGRRFYAIVLARHDRELVVEPIDRRVTYHRVKAREVIGIWRKSRARAVRNVETIKRAARPAGRTATVTPASSSGSWWCGSRTRSSRR